MMDNYCMKCMGRLDASGNCPQCGAWTPTERAPHQLAPGTVLVGRYLIGETIGQGGFGITYIGRDLLLDLTVAVKEFYPTGFANRNTGASDKVTVTGDKNGALYERGKERFLDEARILAKYHGEPGIVDVLNFFEGNGTAYIVMEYLDGTDLYDTLSTTQTMDPQWVFTSFQPIMDALERLHADHVYHRDISPDNIMLLRDGTLRLMDFGAARMIMAEAPRTVSVMLKAGYAPEEQYRANGNQGPWTDIYALCATMYKCITGITPADALQRKAGASLVWPSALGVSMPDKLEGVLKKGLSIDAADRYQSIAEMRFAITDALGTGGVGNVPGNSFGEAGADKTRFVSPVTNSAPGTNPTREISWDESHRILMSEDRQAPSAFCTSCGKRLGPDDLFCTHCGKQVTYAPPASAFSNQNQGAAMDIAAESIPAYTPDFAGPGSSVGNAPGNVANTPFESQVPESARSDGHTVTVRDVAAPSETERPPRDAQPRQPRTIDRKSEKRSRTTLALGAIVAIAAVVALVGLFVFPNLLSAGKITAQDSLQDYEWSELSAISQEIAAADNQQDAIEIAKKYNLVNAEGELDPADTKLVKIDGGEQPVHIIGFAHDEIDGGKLAGITFQFVNCLDERAMNNSQSSDSAYEEYAQRRGVPVSQIRGDHPDAIPTNDGGWSDSTMRHWLETDMLPKLPQELREVVVAANKQTNNDGKTEDKQAVTTTSDKLWLLSKAEICGSDKCDSKVTAAEGTAYQLFEEMGVGAKGDADLKKLLKGDSPSYWWLRSPASSSDIYFINIDKDGEFNAGWSDAKSGVAPCFCI